MYCLYNFYYDRRKRWTPALIKSFENDINGTNVATLLKLTLTSIWCDHMCAYDFWRKNTYRPCSIMIFCLIINPCHLIAALNNFLVYIFLFFLFFFIMGSYWGKTTLLSATINNIVAPYKLQKSNILGGYSPLYF